MGNFEANYEIILNELQKSGTDSNAYFKPMNPKISDLEPVATNITAKCLSIDSEHQLFRDLKGTYLCDRIERSVYDIRKRKLLCRMEKIRRELATEFNKYEDYSVGIQCHWKRADCPGQHVQKYAGKWTVQCSKGILRFPKESFLWLQTSRGLLCGRCVPKL